MKILLIRNIFSFAATLSIGRLFISGGKRCSEIAWQWCLLRIFNVGKRNVFYYFAKLLRNYMFCKCKELN